jgi:hypothetical protein
MLRARLACEALETREVPSAVVSTRDRWDVEFIGEGLIVLDGPGSQHLVEPAFDPGFHGDVILLHGDVTGDGKLDHIMLAGQGGGLRVRIIDGDNTRTLVDMFCMDPAYRGGLSGTVLDLNGDNRAEFAVSAQLGGGPRVQIFDGTGHQLGNFFAGNPDGRQGAFVFATDDNFDGKDELGTFVPGEGVRTWTLEEIQATGNFAALPPAAASLAPAPPAVPGLNLTPNNYPTDPSAYLP